MRAVLIAVACVVAGAVAWLASSAGPGARATASGPGGRVAPDPVQTMLSGPDAAAQRVLEEDPEAAVAAFDAALAALRRALDDRRGAPAACATMRRLARLDEGAFQQIAALALAADTAPDLRRALLLVVGTIADGRTDELLLEALARFGGDEASALAIIAALGAMRDPPDEDDVFDMAAAPHYAFAGPGGMGITVRREVEDPRAQQALCQLLLDRGRDDVRRAAAAALQFSMAQDVCRNRFFTALQIEPVDGTAGLLAETLGLWTRAHPGLDAPQVVEAIVARAADPGFEEYRLRLEAALEGLPLPASIADRVRLWADPAQPFELRVFALTMLSRQRELSASDRGLLERALGDVDVPIRDLAARLLGALPAASSTTAALLQAFRTSGEWSVRSSVLDALVRVLPAAEVRALLELAAVDADVRVQRQAERLRLALAR